MTASELEKAHRASPFNPFVLHVSDGSSYEVPTPEFLAHKPGTRSCVVLNLNDAGFAWVDLAHVRKVTFAGPPLPVERAG